jgi:hypothetical protein
MINWGIENGCLHNLILSSLGDFVVDISHNTNRIMKRLERVMCSLDKDELKNILSLGSVSREIMIFL